MMTAPAERAGHAGDDCTGRKSRTMRAMTAPAERAGHAGDDCTGRKGRICRPYL
ncbi:MAG: hypothetical protein HFI57_04580 [Lachnospiraceae bacterium]|nr:hypothetical protein [Lachnospiraceae bacterium]